MHCLELTGLSSAFGFDTLPCDFAAPFEVFRTTNARFTAWQTSLKNTNL